MSAEEDEALICRFLNEAYNKGNLTIGDDLLTENCVSHALDTDIEGIPRRKRIAAGFLSAFPDDLQITIEDTVAKRNKVAVQWTARVSQAGQLHGTEPTNRQMRSTGMAIYHLSSGKIEQEWGGNHPLGIMRGRHGLHSSGDIMTTTSDRVQTIVCQRCGRGFVLTATYNELLERKDARVVIPVQCPTCFLADGPLPKNRSEVIWFNTRRRYGFIATETGHAVFFHREQLLESSDHAPREGQAVRFHLHHPRRGRKR